MLLVVLVVVFFLAMRNFKTVAPAAMEVQKHNKAREAGQGAGAEGSKSAETSTAASADSWTPAPPSRPNLSTMDHNTSEHTNAVKDALSQAN